MAEPEYLAVPPAEAVRHFRSKGYVFGFDWRDVDAAEHLVAFTVAKAMRRDILEDIREAVEFAIAEGGTFRQFQQRLEPTLRSKGWWGRREMVDPLTGERRLVQLGSPRRLRTIFDTNIRTATAHGRWQRIQRVKEAMPYLRYVSVLDARTRPEHAAWHGTVLPVDHPWWDTHYPPNGWHCRCTVVQLSERDLERYGFEVSSDPAMRTRTWLNKRTGETVDVPFGIDPGFQRNVGVLDRVEEAVRVAETKHGAGAVVPAPPANPATWQEYSIIGRRAVEELSEDLNKRAFSFNDDFRSRLLERLDDRLGTAEPNVVPATGGRVSVSATGRLQRAVRAFFPSSWIQAGDRVQALVRGYSRQSGGSYVRYLNSQRAPELRVPTDPAVSVHEYVHHLQHQVPGFHDVWRDFYVARTTLADGRQEPTVASKYGSQYRVRKDDWIDDYMGHQSSLELAARVYEILAHGLYGNEAILALAAQDPELLNFAVGFLLRFEP